MNRRQFLGSAAAVGSAGLAGCSLIKPSGDVALKVMNYRDRELPVTTTISKGDETVFSQSHTLAANSDGLSENETEHALVDVTKGTTFDVLVSVDGDPESLGSYTVSCVGSNETQAAIFVNLFERSIRVARNEC